VIFHIGDKVIHWAYGMGDIVRIEEKQVQDRATNCYVLQTPDMTIWIPIDEDQQSSLRLPTPPEDFNKVFSVLTGPGEQLLDDRILRKNQLMAKMNDGQLLSICQVVRDLTHYNHEKKLNDNEKSILVRATKSLVTEWSYSMQIPVFQAQDAMNKMLTVPV
jgi:RNA polymerase-interacting CarD/CdnL/TRCF family regulator